MASGTLAIISAVIGIAGTVASVSAANKETAYRRQVAENNAKLSDYNAQESRIAGGKVAQDRDRAAKAVIGQMLADQSASGLSIGVGSFDLQVKSADKQATRDRTRIVDAAAKDAAGYTKQAEQFRSKSGYLQSAQTFDNLAGAVQIGSSIIGGANKYMNFRRKAALQQDIKTPSAPSIKVKQ